MKTLATLKTVMLFSAIGLVSACSSTPKVAPAPVLTQSHHPEIVQTARGPSLTLKDVLFDFEESTLRSEAQPTIAKAVTYLKANPDRDALVEGHTDHTGDETYNEWLSLKRSESIKNALVAQGIDEKRIKMDGLGETKPVADNSTLEGRQENRRVEIIFQISGQRI